MVRASSLMRSTAAAYSSRTPGLTRVRKTVISIGSDPFSKPNEERFMWPRRPGSSLRRGLLRHFEFRFANERANLNVIFGVIFLPRQFLRRSVLGICLPGALPLFMRELDDRDTLAVIGIEVLVRNIAWHRPRQLVHTIGQATYSSRRPGFNRERNTVTIIVLFPSVLLFDLWQRAELRHPWLRRAPPDLPPRRKLISLAQNADAERIKGLDAFADRGRIERRAASTAKCLHPRPTALGGGLDVRRGLSAHLQRCPRDGQGKPKRGAGRSLAIGAMTGLGLFRIGL